MKKYATAYVDLFENNTIANVVEAENEIEAMKKAILLENKNDEYIKTWLEGLGEMSIEDFKSAALQGEKSVDAIEIKEDNETNYNTDYEDFGEDEHMCGPGNF